MKKIKCKVCETEFYPKKELRYTAILERTLIGSGTETDCFDCIKCGCQISVNPRYKKSESDFWGCTEVKIPYDNIMKSSNAFLDDGR